MSAEWTKWSDRRPIDTDVTYRWRISPRMILGLMLAPEFSGKMRLCGMGYADSEYWPPYSYWDGYSRSVPDDLEWRVAQPDETDIKWVGLDLLPCPFTGKEPKVEYSGRWIGAPPWSPESFSIKSHMVDSLGWSNVAEMRDAWNLRAN